MISESFTYERPDSLSEAIELLQSHGEAARILAGGHSLLPMMKLRLASPGTLIDLAGVAGLNGIRDAGNHIAIGAMATHRDVAESDIVRRGCPVLADTAAGIGDLQVRNRGTIGGSIAQADPHADYPAVLLALEGEVIVEGPGGSRSIAAADLVTNYLTTSVADDEIVTELRVAKTPQGAYVKFNRRKADWAIVGAAAVLVGSTARIALTGVGSTPVRATAAEQAWNGSNAAEAAAHAGDGLNPTSDTAASGEYRVHLARVLTRRALDQAASAS